MKTTNPDGRFTFQDISELGLVKIYRVRWRAIGRGESGEFSEDCGARAEHYIGTVGKRVGHLTWFATRRFATRRIGNGKWKLRRLEKTFRSRVEAARALLADWVEIEAAEVVKASTAPVLEGEAK